MMEIFLTVLLYVYGILSFLGIYTAYTIYRRDIKKYSPKLKLKIIEGEIVRYKAK